MTRRIFLFRHGQASFGKANYDELSERGRHQTRHLAQHLLGEDVRLDRVFHGSLVRQRDSALPYLDAAGSVGHRIHRVENPAFNEFQAEKVVRHYLPRLTLKRPELGAMLQEEGGFRRHFQTLFVAVIESWQADEYPHPRIEDWPSFRHRVRKGFSQVVDQLGDGEQAGIFTSGGVISVLLQPLMDEDDGIMARLNQRIANASITMLELDGDRHSLNRFNDYSHLEPLDLVTFR